MAKEYLLQKGIPYEEKNVDVDYEARNEMIKRGIRAVPSFLIGGEVIVGLDRTRIEELVNSTKS